MPNARALKVIVLFAAVEILIVGGLGASASQHFDFPYVYLSGVAYLVYCLAGYFAARAGAAGWLAGALVGLLDSATWALFGGVGPQPSRSSYTVSSIVMTVVIVTLTAAAFGVLGGWLARRRIRRALA
jgi:threonine/homoserine/homoserine lactone efflux protein